MKIKFRYIMFLFMSMFFFNSFVYAKSGKVTAEDGLNLRDGINGNIETTLVYGTWLEVLEENIGTTSGVCDNWYSVRYGNYEYVACGDYIEIKKELTKDDIISYREFLTEQGFPESYLDGLVSLHELHPNWEFKVFNADITFLDMLEIENNSNGWSLIWDKYAVYDGYKSLESWSYNYLTDVFYNGYSGGGTNWYAASYNTIAYYLDPRNFFNEKQIFMFEMLGYNEEIHLRSGVEAMLEGSFMEDAYADRENNKTYVDAFMDSAKKNNVSPYILVSRVIQEVGRGGSTIVSGTVSGYEGYYNFYNICASGQQDYIIANGLEYAKKMGWDTPYKAIVGGATFLSDKYIDVGQDNLYLQKWDLFGPLFGRHQYQQNIQAPSTECIRFYTAYNDTGLLDSKIVFSIPVFKDNSIPSSTKLDDPGNPNNFLSSLKVNDTVIFDSATYDTTFDIELDENVTSVSIDATKVNENASIKGLGSVTLSGASQSIVITVIAENGDLRDYVINVRRNLTSSDTDVSPDPVIPNEDDKDTPEEETLKIDEVLSKIKYNYDDSYFYGFAVGTKIDSIVKSIQNVDKSIVVKSYNMEGKIKEDGIIASGDKITIALNGEEKTYMIVLYGDVNGDGLIDKLDALAILRNYYGYIEFNDFEKQVANINKDKNVDKLDALAILRDLYGYSKITQ